MNSSVIENLIAALIALEMCYFWIYRSFLIKHYACMRRRANLSEDWGIDNTVLCILSPWVNYVTQENWLVTKHNVEKEEMRGRWPS